MAVCTFFGHRECPQDIKQKIRVAVTALIETYGVTGFYVGNQGKFDAYVRSVLKEMAQKYPEIWYAVVLAYLPGKKMEYEDDSDTMLPEGIELVHPRYAIAWRNEWMLKNADYVVAYVTHSWGGAARYIDKARRKKKRIVDLTKEQNFKQVEM